MRIVIILAVLGLLGFAGYRAYMANRQESAEARTLGSLPSTVRHVVAQMDAASQASFFNEYERKKRKLSLSYLLWLACGAHYLYNRKLGTQFVLWLFAFALIGEIWWFIDVFRMPSIVRTANEQVAREALQTLHIGATFAQLNGQTPTQFLTSSAPAPAPPPALSSPSSSMLPPHVAAGHAAPDDGAPQWAADPAGRHELRFWDGAIWTAHVSTASVLGTDPV